MDSRKALIANTILPFQNKEGGLVLYTIVRELGRGGSCIVYEAYHEATTGDKKFYRIKECYPYKLQICREDNGELVPDKDDEESFWKFQENFKKDFSLSNKLFYEGRMYSSMVDQLDVYALNNTTYIVSAFSSENTLATYKPKSIKECITLVKKVSYVLENIHEQGYLYLDIKPDNILVTDGLDRGIQLFDFDSLVSVDLIKQSKNLRSSDIRLSFSKGFAPIELEMGKVKRLGYHTDVFSLSVLLFWLLFGKTPMAIDCDFDAEYDFSQIRYDYNLCDDKLFSELTNFFHSTLSNYYLDRLQSMSDVYSRLVEIEKYADETRPRIFSTRLMRPKYALGRSYEFTYLDQFIAEKEPRCMIITGMGGIGKSTLIREYLAVNKNQFDTVLYMNYVDNMEKTISNDENIHINTLSQANNDKCGQRYFDKKIKKLRELVRDTDTIIVIDNYSGDIDDDTLKVLNIGCKVILVSRQVPDYSDCKVLDISSIRNLDILQRIFEKYLGHSIQESEVEYLHEIIKQIDGHTLVLELIAKQIANSHLTLSEALALTKEYGFSKIAPEKVGYNKDGLTGYKTIRNIMEALFTTNNISENQKLVLKTVSLLSVRGIEVRLFQKILSLPSLDDLNALQRDGWLKIDGDVLTMHPVIQETIRQWEWADSYLAAAESLLKYFYIEIKIEATKNNFPKQVRDGMLAGKQEFSREYKKSSWIKKVVAGKNRIIEIKCPEGLPGEVFKARAERLLDESPADRKKLERLLFLSEEILNNCQYDSILRKLEIYTNLYFVTVLYMPRYREDYILSEANKIFDSNVAHNPVTIMEIYKSLVDIYVDTENEEAIELILQKARELAQKSKSDQVIALYYDMCSTYYDFLLCGAYYAETPEEKEHLDKMLDFINKTIRLSKKFAKTDVNHLYAKNLIAKAVILLRSGRGKQKEIADLIDRAKEAVLEFSLPYADVRLHYYLICAWYDALMLNNIELTNLSVAKVRELSSVIIPTELDEIDNVLVPCANIYCELGQYEQALNLLFEGIQVCSSHANTEVYARKKQEISPHFIEVCLFEGEYSLCQKFINLLDYENEDIIDPMMWVMVPEDIRTEVQQHL